MTQKFFLLMEQNSASETFNNMMKVSELYDLGQKEGSRLPVRTI
jgi:hypothetical protein